jgi:phage terminase Nu1 subunit (DNA packaging protein)
MSEIEASKEYKYLELAYNKALVAEINKHNEKLPEMERGKALNELVVPGMAARAVLKAVAEVIRRTP